MKNIFQLIKRHKLLFLICLMAFVILVVMFYIFFSLFIGGNDPYGSRLKGISSVKISSSLKKDVVSSIKEHNEVEKAEVRVQGKIVYIHIYVKEGVAVATAKDIATKSLEKFSDEEKKFYDFGFLLKENKDDGYIVTGSKNIKSDIIVWIKGWGIYDE